MRRLEFVTADVFTERTFGGNPLAVFFDAAGLDGAVMQRIAREMSLSETIFLSPPDNPNHAFKARIFTPAAELPFAGHPTVGAAVTLAAVGALPGAAPWDIVLEEGVGPVPIHITETAASRFFAQFSCPRLPAPVGEAPSAAAVAAVLNLPESAIGAPAVYSAGVPFVIAPVVDRAALSAIRLDLAAWRARLASAACSDVYAITMDDWRAGRTVHARMFSPAMGILEDPATGSAAAALAGWLADRQNPPDGRAAWDIVQGEDMARPSLIKLEADFRDGKLTAARIGGAAVVVSRGVFHLPD